jgi:hypothetical protein
VRCIKPNPGSKPLLLDDSYALHQLKCGGVMEAVRISCAGECVFFGRGGGEGGELGGGGAERGSLMQRHACSS